MSRAPANETPVSALNSALTPFGVIDFVDNHCMQVPLGAQAPVAAAPGSVVGGPPAYLDAHGIRYTPSASLESPADPAVPSLEPAEPQPSVRSHVSKRELDSRVDERIRKFMSSSGALRSDYDREEGSGRLRSGYGGREERLARLRQEIERSRDSRALRRDLDAPGDYYDERGARRDLDAHGDYRGERSVAPLELEEDYTDQLRALHEKIERLERQREDLGVDADNFRSRARSMESSAAPAMQSGASSAGAAKRLEQLRKDCEAAAAAASKRLAQSAEPARASKGRSGKRPEFDY